MCNLQGYDSQKTLCVEGVSYKSSQDQTFSFNKKLTNFAQSLQNLVKINEYVS